MMTMYFSEASYMIINFNLMNHAIGADDAVLFSLVFINNAINSV